MGHRESTNQRYVQSSEAVFQDIDQEGILMDMTSGKYLRLNTTATAIWKQLESPLNGYELAQQLSVEYGADFQSILNDVNEALQDMSRLGVIKQTV